MAVSEFGCEMFQVGAWWGISLVLSSNELRKQSDHIRVIPGQVITKNGRTPSDFSETWYIHILSEVINPHPFLASYVCFLQESQISPGKIEGTFSQILLVTTLS